jgi:hypothetical protein
MGIIVIGLAVPQAFALTKTQIQDYTGDGTHGLFRPQ